MDMEDAGPGQAEPWLDPLQQQVLALGEIVESMFADAIMALIEGDFSTARDVRGEDYKAHKVWLETDALCSELLMGGELDEEHVKLVLTAMKVAMNLKRVSDQAMELSRHLGACPDGSLPTGPLTETLPQMAETSQSMLSSGVEILARRNVANSNGVRMMARKLASLNSELVEHVSEALDADGGLSGKVGTALVRVAGILKQVGAHAEEVTALLAHVYPSREEGEELAEPQ
jgi:phosphate transport system protein